MNATLTQLNIYSISSFCGWIYVCILWFDLADNLWIIDNSIGSEGGKALAEALKVNAMLMQLNLSGMSSFCEWIFVFCGMIWLIICGL